MMGCSGATDAIIAALADQQGGVVDHRQLTSRGVTRRQIDARLAKGWLIPLWPGVYAVGHRFVTRRGRLLAATRATGGVVGTLSAAAEWDLMRSRERVSVIVPPATSKGRKLDGIDVHRWRLEPADVTTLDEVPLTTPMRTVFDVSSMLDDQQLLKVLEQAERTRTLDTASLDALLSRHPRRKGTPTLRTALASYDGDLAALLSELEKVVARVCRRIGHPPPLRNVVMLGRERDFVFPARRLIVEADGWTTHGTREAFERDTARDADALVHGWNTIRVTWRQARSGVAERALTRLLSTRGS